MSISPILPEVYGQIGNVRGKVQDEQGNPIEGARIRIEGLQVSRKYELETDSKGEYYHGGVNRQGTYRVIVEKEGFQSSYAEGVQPGQNRNEERGLVDFTLRRGQAGRLAFEMTDEEIKRAEELAETAEERAAASEEIQGFMEQGLQLYNDGSYDQALVAFNQALVLDDQQPSLLANIGNSHAKLNQNDQAVAAYEKAIAISPEDATLFQNLGGIYASMGDTVKAQELYEKAVGLSKYGDPKDAAVNYYNMGVTFINSGQNEEAVDALTKALDADPSYAEAHYQMGITLLGTGDMEGSVKHLNHYLELAPDGPNAEVAKQLVGQLQ